MFSYILITFYINVYIFSLFQPNKLYMVVYKDLFLKRK